MSFPWMHCRVFTIGSGPACGATGKTKSQAMTSVVPFGLQAAMTANDRAGRGLHGRTGGREWQLERGGGGGNLGGGRGWEAPHPHRLPPPPWPGLTKPPAAGIDDPSVRPAAPPESVESAAGPSRLAGWRGARVTPASGTTEQTRKERAAPT